MAHEHFKNYLYGSMDPYLHTYIRTKGGSYSHY